MQLEQRQYIIIRPTKSWKQASESQKINDRKLLGAMMENL